MSLFFVLNNLHFALEILGALAFLMVAWLAIDAFRIRKDFLTASRWVGFLALAIWQAIHALGLELGAWTYAGFLFYIFGLLMVLLNLLLERPAPRPEFKAVLILPAIALTAFYTNALAALLYSAVAVLAYLQYKKEFKKMLKPFWAGFAFLGLGALFALFYDQESLGIFWTLGHILEVVGFAMLAGWVWQYLQLRIREEMILIFISSAFFISIVVTLAFSVILVGQMENTAKTNLLSNARVLDFAISRLREESLAKTKFLASAKNFGEFLVKNDFAKLEAVAGEEMKRENLGFLLILNKSGEVVLRAHALTQKEDNLADEKAAAAALSGKAVVTVEPSSAEKFSVRAGAPLIYKEKIVGALIAGYHLDNALADNIKRITGLELSIYEGDLRVATTEFSRDGRTRSVGIRETNQKIKEIVLRNGEDIVVRTEILSRPYLASYLPLRDTDGKIVGMLSAAQPQQEILSLANATNRLTLVTVAILMLILAWPVYLLTKRLSGEVV